MPGSSGCRSAAAAMRSVCWACAESVKATSRTTGRIRRNLRTEHHDLSGFNERGGGLADGKLHFVSGFGVDDGGDDLASDGELDLGEQAVIFQLDDAPGELIASADGSHHLALCSFRTFGLVKEAVELGLGNTVMAAGCFGGLELALVDPLLDGGVGDAEAERSLP